MGIIAETIVAVLAAIGLLCVLRELYALLPRFSNPAGGGKKRRKHWKKEKSSSSRGSSPR